ARRHGFTSFRACESPREESNLCTRGRSPVLFRLSYEGRGAASRPRAHWRSLKLWGLPTPGAAVGLDEEAVHGGAVRIGGELRPPQGLREQRPDPPDLRHRLPPRPPPPPHPPPPP